MSRLRSWGVTVLYGDDVVAFGPPGGAEARIDDIPWHLVVKALPAP